jgi:hypothetical protein
MFRKPLLFYFNLLQVAMPQNLWLLRQNQSPVQKKVAVSQKNTAVETNGKRQQ